MNRSGLRPRLAAPLTAIVACVSLLSLSSAPAWAAAGTITESPIPTKGTPFDITAGPDGNLWFTGYSTGEIGRITPGGSITKFALPIWRQLSFGHHDRAGWQPLVH
jgi:streptogramin lyase